MMLVFIVKRIICYNDFIGTTTTMKLDWNIAIFCLFSKI